MNKDTNNNANSIEEIFGAPIYSYTRKQAVEDGMQVAVDEKTSREAGIVFPVYLTSAVFEAYVKVPEKVEGQDVEGRLWDILWMLRMGIRRSTGGGQRIEFQLYVRNDNRRPRLVTLAAEVGPRDIDDPAPALTVMMPDED